MQDFLTREGELVSMAVWPFQIWVGKGGGCSPIEQKSEPLGALNIANFVSEILGYIVKWERFASCKIS